MLNCLYSLFILFLPAPQQHVADHDLVIRNANYQFHVQFQGFRFGFSRPDGSSVVQEHAISGISFSDTASDQILPVIAARLRFRGTDSLLFVVTNAAQEEALVTVILKEHYARIGVSPSVENETDSFIIDVRTAPHGPAYGLGDHGGYDSSTNVFGFRNDDFGNRDNAHRFISNFSIFPAQGFAQVLFEQGRKRVEISARENRLGARKSTRLNSSHSFASR